MENYLFVYLLVGEHLVLFLLFDEHSMWLFPFSFLLNQL